MWETEIGSLHVAEVRDNRVGLGRMADENAVGELVVEQWHHVRFEELSQLLYLDSLDSLDQIT